MKKTILISALLSTFLCADTNETKIFLDKFSPQMEKIKKENSGIEKYDAGEISVARFTKDMNVSQTIKLDAAAITKNRLRDSKIEQMASEDAKVVNTSKFKKQFGEAKEHLLYDKKLNWGEQNTIAQKYLKDAGESNEQNFYFNSKETIYVVISSSMPRETILNYLESTKYIQNNVVFVLQGAIGGLKKLRPTMIWIKDLITTKYASARIVIDPRFTKNFKIKQVPAILYTQKDMFELAAEEYANSQKNEVAGDTYIFYGDMPFRYAIKELNDKKSNPFLENILKKLDTK